MAAFARVGGVRDAREGWARSILCEEERLSYTAAYSSSKLKPRRQSPPSGASFVRQAAP
jgi:hypothetical protein